MNKWMPGPNRFWRSTPAIVLPSVDWVGAILLLAQCICVVTMIAILEHVTPETGNDR